MQAVLYICHGSRMKEAVDEAIDFTEKCMKIVDTPIQACCFLELSSPTIHQGVAECVERGATKIAVVPVLLLTAGHAKKDIPAELDHAKTAYPNVAFTYGQPLSIHEKLIDVLVDHIEEKKKITKDMNLLLVGRGSSDEEAVEDLKSIARLLQQRIKVQSVQVCFLAAAKPSFEKKLRQTLFKGTQNTVILPYLLFTGLLMQEIRNTANQLHLTDDQEITVCDYVGKHRNAAHVLKERVLELM